MQNANCPLFYQHFTAKLMERTIKQQITRLSAPETGARCSDLRYVAGYIIRNVRQHLKVHRMVNYC